MLYTPDVHWDNSIRFLEIHQSQTGWYYTIYKDTLLVCISAEGENRDKVIRAGIKHFNQFCYQLRKEV